MVDRDRGIGVYRGVGSTRGCHFYRCHGERGSRVWVMRRAWRARTRDCDGGLDAGHLWEGSVMVADLPPLGVLIAGCEMICNSMTLLLYG
jgi:hypothetical protein